ncbi:MAG: hypothetical protein GX287_07660 [Fusobacteria bacterium]|nr:hypothetical protein [Fusobacteriota bacterium]
MYSVGENFQYIIDNQKLILTVVGDMIIKNLEYLIVENNCKERFIFLYNDEKEIIEIIKDDALLKNLFEIWNSEFLGIKEELNLWEEDEDNLEDNYLDSKIESINENSEVYDFSIDDLLINKGEI